MTTTQLIILLLVIVVAVALVLLLVRRSSARKDEARVEAAGIRAEAEAVASAMAGQEMFAQQADERAELARAEAEAAARQAAEAAREADRLAAEAGQHRAVVEETRTDYTSMLTRADEVDPDVRTPAPASTDAVALAADEPDPTSDAADREPQTRAEARARREDAERAAWASSPAAPVPGLSGAAVAGAGVWAEEHDQRTRDDEPATSDDAAGDADGPAATSGEPAWWDEPTDVEGGRIAPVPAGQQDDEPDEERSARIATAVDYRDPADDVAAPAEADEHPHAAVDPAAGSGEVWTGAAAGTEAGMTTTSGSSDEPTSTPTDDDEAVDAARDAQTPTNEWGGPHDATGAEGALQHEGTSAEASAEVPDEDRPDEDRPDADRPDEAADSEALAHGPGQDVPAAEGSDGSQGSDGSGMSAPERYDTTPERDWAADEPALLAENEERGERLAEDRADMERAAAAAGMDTPHAVEPEPETEPEREADDGRARDEVASHDDHDEPVDNDHDEPAVSPDAPAVSPDDHDAPAEEQPASSGPRRISEFHEIRDGGYGMGSAAALDDGAQPMDHPVQAYHDTMTFRVPGDPGYDEARADVWFYDAAAAERSGFRRSEG